MTLCYMLSNQIVVLNNQSQNFSSRKVYLIIQTKHYSVNEKGYKLIDK